MHIALISTYPPAKCGIANYSQRLAHALRAQGAKVTVLAERTFQATTTEEPDTIRCWKRGARLGQEILTELETLRPDVVHLQHEEAILGQDARLPTLLTAIRAMGIPTVVTFHSVYTGHLGVPGFRYSPHRFQSEIAKTATRIIVHQIDGCHDSLVGQGISEEQISVIPHGTSVLELMDRKDARLQLDIPEDRALVLAIGFIHKKKGLHTLIRAMPGLREKVPSAGLLIAGSFRQRPWDLLYNKRLARSMAPGINDGWIDLRSGFHSTEMMNTMLAAADVLALPYRQRYGSASGILHMALGAGKPVLCADGYKFAEAKRAWGQQHPSLFPPPEDAKAWSQALSELLGSPTLLTSIAEKSSALGHATSWEKVALQHLEAFAIPAA